MYVLSQPFHAALQNCFRDISLYTEPEIEMGHLS